MIYAEIKKIPELQYRQKEAFNTLCTNLAFVGGSIKSVLITSCHSQEGKSFVSMNLLCTLAGLGKKVVLVDADIRVSVMQRRYGIDVQGGEDAQKRGLTSYLAEYCESSDILCETNIPNAYIILAGKTVMNSLPLISTPKFGQLIDELKEEFDIVLIDSPPVCTIIDAAKIAENADGCLFVIESDSVNYRTARSAIAQLEKSGKPILGTVLNKFDEKKYGRYKFIKNYDDRYYYETKKKPLSKFRRMMKMGRKVD